MVGIMSRHGMDILVLMDGYHVIVLDADLDQAHLIPAKVW